MERIEGVQALRGAAALAVVLFHAAVLSVDYADGLIYAPWVLVGKGGVDLFFVLSGFIMVHTTWHHVGTPHAPSAFAISRFSRVYPAYWVLSIPVLIYWLHNPAGVNSTTGGVDPVASFLLLPSPSLPLVPVAWTLVHEVFFYLVFWGLLVIGSRRFLIGFLCVWGGASFANSAVGWVAPASSFDTIVLSGFNAEFVAGAFLALARRRERSACAFVVAGLAVVACTALAFQLMQMPQSIPAFVRVSLFLPPSLLLLWGALHAKGAPRFLVRIGDWSYSLYLVHILVMHLIYRVATRRSDIEWTVLSVLALAILMLLISLVASYLFHRVIEAPLSLATRRWLHERMRVPTLARNPGWLKPGL